MTDAVAGCLIAFVAAITVVYIDGYQALRTRLFEVPALFWRSMGFGAFAAACGLIAVGAYMYSLQSTPNSTWLAAILGTDIENRYLRALYTGLAVLAIIRSKLLQVRGADVGFEYAYGEIRIKCLGAVLTRWTAYRDTLIRENLDRILARPNADTEIKARIEAAVAFADAEYRASVASQLEATFKSRPSTPLSPADPGWRAFYRALVSMALENCGSKALN